MNKETLNQFFSGLHIRLGEQHFYLIQQLINFGQGMMPLLEELDKKRAKVEREKAYRFSVFNYILPNENDISDILADLFDPHGTHGQGDLFLQLFVEHFLPGEKYDLRRVKCLREQATDRIRSDRRRIDLVLDCGECAIAFENKPWAQEQPDQLRDYRDHLDRTYRRFKLIYLSGSGVDPISIDKGDERVIIRTYGQDLLAWIQSCIVRCQAERVSQFLADFAQFIESEFVRNYREDGTMMSLEESKTIVDYALENQQNLSMALKIAKAQDAIKMTVLNRLISRIEVLMKEELGPGWNYYNEFGNFSQRYGGWYFALPEWEKAKIYIGIEQDYPFAMNMYFGLSKGEKESNRQEHDVIRNKINNNLMQGKFNENWIWWNFLNPPCRDLGTDDVLTNLFEDLDKYAGLIVTKLLSIKNVVSDEINKLVT